jgi:hypothetical protein
MDEDKGVELIDPGGPGWERRWQRYRAERAAMYERLNSAEGVDPVRRALAVVLGVALVTVTLTRKALQWVAKVFGI